MDMVARRLELLKLEGLGFSQVEVVNELSQKLSCSKRVLYKDFESREVWQPLLQSVVKSADVSLKLLNTYERICRQALMRFLTAPSELAKLPTLNFILNANSLVSETAILPRFLDAQRSLDEKAKNGENK